MFWEFYCVSKNMWRSPLQATVSCLGYSETGDPTDLFLFLFFFFCLVLFCYAMPVVVSNAGGIYLLTSMTQTLYFATYSTRRKWTLFHIIGYLSLVLKILGCSGESTANKKHKFKSLTQIWTSRNGLSSHRNISETD